MEVGLCNLDDHRADPVTGVWTTQDERHAHIMEYLLAAKPLGFDTLVCGEHHFSGFIMSVPQIFLAWIAGQTERIRLATGVTLLPHHDPVRIAEGFATLDVVSDGRANHERANSDPHDARANRFARADTGADEGADACPDPRADLVVHGCDRG